MGPNPPGRHEGQGWEKGRQAPGWTGGPSPLIPSSRSARPPAVVASSGAWSSVSTPRRGCVRRTTSSVATRPGLRAPGHAAPRTATSRSPHVSAPTPRRGGGLGARRGHGDPPGRGPYESRGSWHWARASSSGERSGQQPGRPWESFSRLGLSEPRPG